MAAQKQDDQLERTFSSYVRIQDVVLKTYLGRWTIGRSGERGSGISVLPARYDDDDDDDDDETATDGDASVLQSVEYPVIAFTPRFILICPLLPMSQADMFKNYSYLSLILDAI